MSTKICTSIEQSKKLLSLGLDPCTADMWYSYYGNSKYNPTIAYEGQQWFLCQIRNSLHDDIPCWSLTALFELMPPYLFELERGIDLNIYRNINSKGWHVSYMPNNIIDMQKDKFRTDN